MMRSPQVFFWIAGAAIAIYLGYLLVSGLMTPQTPPNPAENQMMMRGIVAQGRGNRSNWRFIADTSEISPDGYTTTYHNVHDATYYRDGRPRYKLTAAVVTVDSRNQNYAASGGVHVWSIGSAQTNDFRSDEAYWSEAGQTLACPGITHLIYKGSALTTTRLMYNLKTGAAELGQTSIDYRTASPSPPAQQTAAP